MNSAGIDTHEADGIFHITLIRTQARNALNKALIASLREVFLYLQNTSLSQVVHLSALGDIFCAGACLHDMQAAACAGYAINQTHAESLADMFYQLATLRQIVVAEVSGPALGGGLGLVCCADIVLASKQAYFALPELRLGLIPAVIAPYLVRILGLVRTAKLLYGSEPIDANLAAQWSLVHAVYPDRNSLAQATTMQLQRLLQAGAVAPAMSKKLLQLLKPLPDLACRQKTAAMLADIRQSQPAVDRLTAFVQGKSA